MQVDLKTEEDFEVAGENKADKNVSALDHGRVSLRYDSKKLSALFGLGWIFQESDYPSPVNEDLNAFELEGRINVKPFSKSSLRQLSLNADVSLNIGWVNKTFPANREFTVRPVGRIGASYTMKLGGVELTPFAWGGAGWYMDREEVIGMVYEGKGGFMLKWNNLESNLIGGYNNVTGIEAAIRAFYNDPGWWGVGLQLFYNFISKEQNGTEEDQHIINGIVLARLQVLEKLLGKLALWPYIQAGREINSGVTSILGGVMGRWGLVPARRTEFRPSTDTLPEAR
jgi:hypothetical protein